MLCYESIQPRRRQDPYTVPRFPPAVRVSRPPRLAGCPFPPHASSLDMAHYAVVSPSVSLSLYLSLRARLLLICTLMRMMRMMMRRNAIMLRWSNYAENYAISVADEYSNIRIPKYYIRTPLYGITVVFRYRGILIFVIVQLTL